MNKIIISIKDYIVNRTSSEFYNKLEIYRLEISFGSSSWHLSEYSKYHVHHYWINYTCKVKGVFYSFALQFDEEGKMIFNLNFPGYDHKFELDKLIDPEIAIKKAKSLRKSLNRKKILVNLSYLKELNIFCWVIQKDPKVEKNIKKNPNYYEYISEKIYINAFTNEFVKDDMKKERIYGPKTVIHLINSEVKEKE